MLDSIIVPAPDKDQKVEITTVKKKREPYPGYTMWGNGKATKAGGKSVDLLDITKELRKPEITLMQFLRDEMQVRQAGKSKEPNIIEPAKSAEFTPYLKTILKKYYAHMECLGILRRIQRGKYVLNPRLYIPYAYQEEMNAIWDSTTKTPCD